MNNYAIVIMFAGKEPTKAILDNINDMLSSCGFAKELVEIKVLDSKDIASAIVAKAARAKTIVVDENINQMEEALARFRENYDEELNQITEHPAVGSIALYNQIMRDYNLRNEVGYSRAKAEVVKAIGEWHRTGQLKDRLRKKFRIPIPALEIIGNVTEKW